jgi:hypothetical protein
MINKKWNAGLYLLRRLRGEYRFMEQIQEIYLGDKIRKINKYIFAIQKGETTEEIETYVRNYAQELLHMQIIYARAAHFVEDKISYENCRFVIGKCQQFLYKGEQMAKRYFIVIYITQSGEKIIDSRLFEHQNDALYYAEPRVKIMNYAGCIIEPVFLEKK